MEDDDMPMPWDGMSQGDIDAEQADRIAEWDLRCANMAEELNQQAGASDDTVLE